MAISKLVLDALRKKGIPDQTVHSRKRAIRKKVNNAISSEVALDIVAANEGIDIHKLLTKDKRIQELTDFKQARGTLDFTNGKNTSRRQSKENDSKEEKEKSPYDMPLSKYQIDSELIRDCKLIKPYRNAVTNACLTLETRMREILNVSENVTGTDLVSEAAKQGLFDRLNKSESQGLEMLFRSAVLWVRNPPGHRKVNYDKESAFKLILYVDYLIRLFGDLKNKKI